MRDGSKRIHDEGFSSELWTAGLDEMHAIPWR